MNGLKTFFHNMKYTMLSTFRLKTTLFWTLAFPLLLATFMYMAFGNLFEKDEMFKTICSGLKCRKKEVLSTPSKLHIPCKLYPNHFVIL